MNKKNLILFLLATIISTIAVNAQTDDSIKRSYQSCRSKMIEQMSAEAKKFKMEVNPNTFTSYDTNGGLISAVLVNNAEKATEKEFSSGTDLMLIYVHSDKPKSLPNGFYKVRISEERGRLDTKPLKMRKYTASFLNGEGRILKQTPVNTGNNTGNSPAGYIRFGTVFEDGQWKPAIWFSTLREMMLYLYFGDI